MKNAIPIAGITLGCLLLSHCAEVSLGKEEGESPRLAKEISAVSVGRDQADVELLVSTKRDSDLKANMRFLGELEQNGDFFDLEEQDSDYDLGARILCQSADDRCEEKTLRLESKSEDFPGFVTLRYEVFYALEMSANLSIRDTDDKEAILESMALDIESISNLNSFGHRLLVASIDSINKSFYSYSFFVNDGSQNTRFYQLRGVVGERPATLLQYTVQGDRRGSVALSEVQADVALSGTDAGENNNLSFSVDFVRTSSDPWFDVAGFRLKGSRIGFGVDSDRNDHPPSSYDFVL